MGRLGGILALGLALFSTPALAVFPDFLALDFYAMLGLTNTASPRQIQAALVRARDLTRTDKNEHATPDHAHVLEIAGAVLLSDGGRRQAYDQFLLIGGADKLTVLDQADYMEAAERRFHEQPQRYGTTAAEERVRTMKALVRENPFEAHESRSIGNPCTKALRALSAGYAAAWAAGIAGVGALGTWGFRTFVEPNLPGNRPPAPNPKPPPKESISVDKQTGPDNKKTEPDNKQTEPGDKQTGSGTSTAGSERPPGATASAPEKEKGPKAPPTPEEKPKPKPPAPRPNPLGAGPWQTGGGNP